MLNKTLYFQDLGFLDYEKTWNFQEQLLRKIVSIKVKNRKEKLSTPTPNYFLFVEHPHVYTLGKSGKEANMLINEVQLKQKEITFFKTNRGGDITYHGPGQIVGYPILDLENFFTDINKYLRLLEEVIIMTLHHYGIKGERSSGETGVWIGVDTPFARKICAMGIRASRWVTMHGFALNVNTDLGYFDNIIPCGIKDKSVTSLRNELRKPQVSISEVKAQIIKNFQKVFEVKFTEIF